MKNGVLLRLAQLLLLTSVIGAWYVLTETEVLPPFFFGKPLLVFDQIVVWFADRSIFPHLGITLLETLLAFVIGTSAGLVCGLWLALSPLAASLLDPYVKAFNSMPRVILAPIFAVWFGLGIWSKVFLGITLVFFIVFFSVFHGVRQVNPIWVASAKLMGGGRFKLLRYVYLPSAMAWVFSSLHAAVGMAFVGSVIGEYLGSASGVGYLILQAEGVFDINAVLAGIVLLTICALLLDWVVTQCERYFLRWQPAASEHSG
ncbi:MAG: ABC transporter permease [Betaproteobacteria bacterium]